MAERHDFILLQGHGEQHCVAWAHIACVTTDIVGEGEGFERKERVRAVITLAGGSTIEVFGEEAKEIDAEALVRAGLPDPRLQGVTVAIDPAIRAAFEETIRCQQGAPTPDTEELEDRG